MSGVEISNEILNYNTDFIMWLKEKISSLESNMILV